MRPTGGKRPAARMIPTFRYDRQQAESVLWPRSHGITFAPPRPDEQALFARLLPVLAATPSVAFAHTPEAMALAGRADATGFALELWQVDAAWFWVLRERDDTRRGAGTYLFRAPVPDVHEDGSARAAPPPGDAPLVVLQAPHAYFDLHTGHIAAAIFFDQATHRVRVDALMTNSLHRYQQTADRRGKEASNPADVCHNPKHLFQHATRHAARAAGSRPARFIQLHGFGEPDAEGPGEERDEDAPAATREQPVEYPDIIVSAGRRTGSSTLGRAVATALGNAFGPESVRRYPEEIRVLGGTTNVQGRLLRNRNNMEFLHIEMSRGFRERLLANPAERAAFAGAVLGHAPPR